MIAVGQRPLNKRKIGQFVVDDAPILLHFAIKMRQSITDVSLIPLYGAALSSVFKRELTQIYILSK